VERPRPAPAVAVHHHDPRRARRLADPLFRSLPLEARIAAPENDPLHPAVSRDELEAWSDEGSVVGVRLRIEEMDAGEVALSAAYGGESSLAADRNELAGDPARAQAAEEHVKTQTMAADDDQIDRLRRRGADPQDVYWFVRV